MKNLLLKILYHLSQWVGRAHAPFSHKLITAIDYHKALDILQPGDVLLSLTRGELSNIMIPGEWKHAALFFGEVEGRPTVIEAIGIGVVEKDLISFMFKKDCVGIWRPSFANTNHRLAAAVEARSKVGYPYDYEFKSGNKAFYCSELICSVYNTVTEGNCPMKPRHRLGIDTILPIDIARAQKHFKYLWESGPHNS